METTRDTGKHTIAYQLAESTIRPYFIAMYHACIAVTERRHYCSRRLRRMRRSLKFTHGHRHRFQKKTLTIDKVTKLQLAYNLTYVTITSMPLTVTSLCFLPTSPLSDPKSDNVPPPLVSLLLLTPHLPCHKFTMDALLL